MSFQQQSKPQPKLHDPMKTPKGTLLPLLDLRGKPYLQVPHRIVWFREDHPDWIMEVNFVKFDDQMAMARAEIRDAEGKIKAVAHKVEHKAHFADYIEKAETSAIGRALAMIGYGTQFAPDLDEEERVVDAPVVQAKQSKPTPKTKSPAKKALEEIEAADISPGEYEIPSGSLKGKRLKEFSESELQKMHDQIVDHWFNLGKPVPKQSQDLILAIKACLSEREMIS